MNGGCKDGGDHGKPYDVNSDEDRRGFGMISEGVCPTCEIPADRTDDGFAVCPCCTISWRLDGHMLVARFDASMFFAEVEP